VIRADIGGLYGEALGEQEGLLKPSYAAQTAGEAQ